jgi:hypothetical protein
MAICDAIAAGRTLPCKSSVGGIRAVYFVNDGDMTSVTFDSVDTDVIDAVAGTPTAYKYSVKGANSFTETITASPENGTVFFAQELSLTLPQLSIKDHKNVKLLAYARPKILVEDENGNVFIMGLQRGADLTGGSIVTGAAMGDMSGYTLTFSGMEKTPANFLGTSITSAGFTVVDGI